MTALTAAPARDRSPGPSRVPGARLMQLGGLGVIVAGSFFFVYTRSDMWLDEALSINIARLPLGDLRAALRRDGAPPAYYLLLHAWTSLFGTSDLAARSLSSLIMGAAVVTLWFVARRWAGTAVAWATVIVMMANPYAYRYATEARMYALEVLLMAVAILLVQRMLASPSIATAAGVAIVVAISVYTQYWSFSLIATFGVMLCWMIWRDRHRAAATQLLVATVAGLATFAPWIPTFMYQRAHTGTPWGTAVLPGLPFAQTMRDFAGAGVLGIDVQEGWLLFFVLVPLLLLGLFGRPTDDHHIEIDVRLQREARAFAFMGGVGLFVALSVNFLAGGAFQTRYSAIVFPFYVLLVGRGLTTIGSRRVMLGVLAVVVALGFAGGMRNVLTQRTQAGQVATIVKHEAQPGDLVVYCPDQVGPSVHRLLQPGLDEVVFPDFAPPEFVDWVDYKARVHKADPSVFARAALQRAGARTLWLVAAPGYTTHTGVCEALSDDLASARSRVVRTLPQSRTFERPALAEFLAPASR